jgi:hypothetical protein
MQETPSLSEAGTPKSHGLIVTESCGRLKDHKTNDYQTMFVFLYFNFVRVFFASSAPENFESNSRARLSSFLASSLSPFL